MSDVTARRTLVKSPPELWAEVSDAEALARHLDAFGEIRITRMEPETTVAWEGEHGRGTVELEPSGWGTRVTVTATLPAEHEQEPVAEPAAAQPEPAPVEPEPWPPGPVAAMRLDAGHELKRVEIPVPAPEPEPREPEPEPEPARKPGFFARLFGRREPEPEPVAPPPVPEPVSAPPPEILELRIEFAAFVCDVPDRPAPPAPVAEPAAPEPLSAATPATLDAANVETVFEAVLDHLGAAHHRPFQHG